MGYRLGVDVGGTFTDVQMQDTESGEVTLGQGALDPRRTNRSACWRECGRRAAEVGSSPQSLELILHGSTVVTNLVLESKGARCGLLTTRRQRADPASGAGLDARSAVRLDGHDQALAAGRAVEHARHRRADGRRRNRGQAARRGRRCARRSTSSSPTASQSVTIGLLNSYVNPGPRAPSARDRSRRASRPADLDLLRSRFRIPRIRAHTDRGAQRLRPAAGDQITSTASSGCSRTRVSAAG